MQQVNLVIKAANEIKETNISTLHASRTSKDNLAGVISPARKHILNSQRIKSQSQAAHHMKRINVAAPSYSKPNIVPEIKVGRINRAVDPGLL